MGRAQPKRPIRPGDVVRIRSSEEILETLDAGGATNRLPFMPEMLQYVGRRFTVARRVEKICDTVSGAYGSRRMRNTIYLEDLRCDGSAHGGCQAACRIYWREDWLERVDEVPEQPAETDTEPLARALAPTTRPTEPPLEPGDFYRCQATDALLASEHLRTRDVRQYVREVTSGNVGLPHALRVLLRAFVTEMRRTLGRVGATPLAPTGSLRPTAATADLQPGDAVVVKSPSEIAETIDNTGRTRGLFFDWEMLPYCNGRHRVQTRVERIIDERTGRMLELSNDCLVLDGVFCSGEHSFGRWFCPRAIPPFWREAWLEPAEPGHTAAPTDRPTASPG